MFEPARLRSVPSSTEQTIELLPSQVEVYDRLARAARAAPVVGYCGRAGMGRTTLLRRLSHELDALFVDVRCVTEAIRAYPAQKWEEVIFDILAGGMRRKRTVVFDGHPDLHGIEGARFKLYSNLMMPLLSDLAIREDKRLVLGGNLALSWQSMAQNFGDAAAVISSGPLRASDYAAFFERSLGEAVAGVDFALLFRSAPMLDLYQLSFLANLLKGRGPLHTADMIACLEAEVLRTNLRIREVEALSFESLPGSEHIAEALETHVVLPFQNQKLSQELGLKPRRGVLLYGPPGTGKTSIGRALAHRMQGRFFLIDGSFVTEPPSAFFAQIEAVVTEAKANSPSVLFIDDADVLFQIEHVAGLSRYLLSLLDGLESETANNVCVMMTAMDAKKVPEALLRSGRVELWLETMAPDEVTRARILERWMVSDMPGHDKVDYSALARATDGFTPADLRRLASDAKLLYAADVVAKKPAGEANDYLQAAIADLIALRAIMAQQLADDSLRIQPYA